MNRCRALSVFFLALLLATPTSIRASWDNNGTPICTEVGWQWEVVITTDGAGGAILVWTDGRNSSSDIYAQRVDGDGVSQWTSGGIRVGDSGGSDSSPLVVSDGAGGAIVVWQGNGTRAQRVDGSGTLLWGDSSGVIIDSAQVAAAALVADAPAGEYGTRVVADGAGGAIVVYGPSGPPGNQLAAQHLDGSGTLLWPGGVLICSLSAAIFPAMIADGAGGAIVAWQDLRFGVVVTDVFAQRVDASGTTLWTTDGVAICLAPNYQEDIVLTTDGVGGAIIAWRDLRSNFDTYAQRIDAAGTPLWTADGNLIVEGPGGPDGIVPDGIGGAIVVSARVFADANIYAQRVSASGDTLWTGTVPLCVAAGDQYSGMVMADGAGGAFVAWRDQRYDTGDIFTQRVDSSGTVHGTVDGNGVCTASGRQWYPDMTLDGAGGAIVAWEDDRSGTPDIYALKISGDATGIPHHPPVHAALEILPNEPNPFANTTDLVVRLPAAVPVRVQVYDVLGRSVRVTDYAATEAGLRRLPFDGMDSAGKKLPSGVYFYRVIAGEYRNSSKFIIRR